MNNKALLLTLFIVILFAIFAKFIFALVFKLVPIILFVGLGYIVYQTIKNKV